ncbi:hypothetical protein BHS06_09365 [Myxococcus xanthus]|nr:hypothetical protein BHS06_09365 [Myxococcus xanthus]
MWSRRTGGIPIHHLVQPAPVPHPLDGPFGAHVHPRPGSGGGLDEPLHDLAHDGQEVHALQVELEPPGVQPRDIQHVVH